MDILAMHFIRPAWLLAVPAGLFLPLAWRHFRRPSGDWSRVCDAHLLRWLSVGKQSQRVGRAGAWAAALVLMVSAIALSGPSWERQPDVSYASRDARVMVIDLSMSMLAQDLKPDRLTRVRYRLSDVLADTTEGQIGLVAYAGDAYVVSPLTSDTNTIANMLPALQPDIMPVAGSRADRAMELAAELLRRSGVGNGEILLITDEAGPSTTDLAARLAAEGFITSVLAVGTPGGAPIPSGGGFITDGQGNVVIARLDLDGLRAIVDAGKGRMNVLENTTNRELPWKAGDGNDFGLRDEGLGERWKDLGPWLVLLLLPLVALGFRRGVLFLAPLVLLPGLLHAPAARAGLWDDLWLRRDQQAQSALREDRPGEAASLARSPDISGEAWYRSGEFPRAAHAWTQSDSADALYNRGNALAQAGDLDAAIAAYDEALVLRPDMEDAVFNKALLEQMKQQQDQQNQDQSGEGESQDGESESDESGEAGEEQQEGEGEGEESEQSSEQEGEGQSGQEQMAQAWSEEDAQAMEQWLRRIPDDPGGLLRRKFRNEHQRRGAPQDEKKTW